MGSGKPKLLSRKCDTCIFRPGNLMDLRPGRLTEMVKGSLQGGAPILCHETLDYELDDEEGNHTGQGPDEAVCRGYYDKHGSQTNLVRIYQRLGGYEEVEPIGQAIST